MSYVFPCLDVAAVFSDLLSFEKLESGILELHRQDVPALQFVSECIVMFTPQAREKGVTLDLVLTVDAATQAAYPGALPLLYSDQFSCDRFKLEQVVRNLVSNAIKFSPKDHSVKIQAFFDTQAVFNAPPKHPNSQVLLGGRSERSGRLRLSERSVRSGRSVRLGLSERTVRSMRLFGGAPESRILVHEEEDNVSGTVLDAELATAREQCDEGGLMGSRSVAVVPGADSRGALVVLVRDYGPGISAANQKKLFKSIIQFSPEKSQGGGGSGFGLFISKGIVDLHEGRIDVSSEGEVSVRMNGRARAWVCE